MQTITTYYHVIPEYTGGDLLSLHQQHGDAAHDLWARRWPEAEALAHMHSRYVHLHDTLEQAQEYAAEYGGVVLAIDASDDCPDATLSISVRVDNAEYPHPVVYDRIEAARVKMVVA